MSGGSSGRVEWLGWQEERGVAARVWVCSRAMPTLALVGEGGGGCGRMEGGGVLVLRERKRASKGARSVIKPPARTLSPRLITYRISGVRATGRLEPSRAMERIASYNGES